MLAPDDQAPPLRLAELVGALSLATDLADGFAAEKCLRTAIVAVRLAQLVKAGPDVTRLCFWAGVLRFVGCTAFAHEEGRSFAAGDDIGLRQALAFAEPSSFSSFARHALPRVARTAPLPQRLKAVGRLLGSPSAPAAHSRAQCDAGKSFARAVGLDGVEGVLAVRDERFDGKGPLRRAKGEQLPLAARIVDVADVAELYAWTLGEPSMRAELARRSGRQLDPAVVEPFLAHAASLLEGLRAPSCWESYLASEPGPPRLVDQPGTVLQAFGRIADVGSVFTLGHSQRVGALARQAGALLKLPAVQLERLELAGAVHDLGRVAVPVGLWEKPGPLTPFERERMQTHSQHTEGILRVAPALHPIAELAGATHERGGGKGYHRRLPWEAIPRVARVLPVADAAVAMDSERPHRPRLESEALQLELLLEVKLGRLDREVVDAVLEIVGKPRPRKERASPLSPRELEVARLVSVGRTNKEVGALLSMSPRTAQKHLLGVYEKLGVESRAGLALTLMEQGLLED